MIYSFLKKLRENNERNNIDELRIKNCLHEMENGLCGIDGQWMGSGGIVYGGNAFQVIRCKKACGFVRKVYEKK